MFQDMLQDLGGTGLGEYSGGSHEAILKFYIGRGTKGPEDTTPKGGNKNKGKQIDSPRFF